MRIREAVETAQGIVAVAGGGGEKRLLLLGDDGSLKTELWQGSGGMNVSGLAPSPDGSRLLASLWRAGQGWDLVEFDYEKGAWKDLTTRPEIEVHPAWLPDGSAVLFSADYGGTFNIWKLELAGGAMTRQTNVPGAAMHPSPRPDGGLDFSLLTPRGTERGELKAVALNAESPPDAPPPPGTAMPLMPVTLSSKPYSGLGQMLPQYWFPVFQLGSPYKFFGGFSTSMTDVLERHHAGLVLLAGLDPVPDVFGGASYGYARFPLQPGGRFERFLDSEFKNGSWRERLVESWGASLGLPWDTAWRHFRISASAHGRRSWDYWRGATATAEAELRETAFQVSAVHDSTRAYAKSIGASDGLGLSLSWTRVNPGLSGDGSWVSGSLSRPVSLWGRSILELSLWGGGVTQGNFSYNLGAAPLRALNPFQWRPVFSLRGYDSPGSTFSGPQAGLAHLGFRFPLFDIERGIMAPPLGIDKIYSRLFYDSAQAWKNDGGTTGPRGSLSLELVVNSVWFYNAVIPLQLGLTRGLDEGGSWATYVILGGSSF